MIHRRVYEKKSTEKYREICDGCGIPYFFEIVRVMFTDVYAEVPRYTGFLGSETEMASLQVLAIQRGTAWDMLPLPLSGKGWQFIDDENESVGVVVRNEENIIFKIRISDVINFHVRCSE